MNFFGGGEAAKPAGPDPLFAGEEHCPRKSRWVDGMGMGPVLCIVRVRGVGDTGMPLTFKSLQ